MFWIWIIHTLGEENLNFRSTPCLSVALKLSMHFSKLNKLLFNTATQFKYQGHLIFAALLIIGQAEVEVRVKFIIPLRCHPLFLTLFTCYLTMNIEHIALAPVVLCKCAKCANELVLLNWSPRDPESPLRILDLICFWCQYLWIVPKARSRLSRHAVCDIIRDLRSGSDPRRHQAWTMWRRYVVYAYICMFDKQRRNGIYRDEILGSASACYSHIYSQPKKTYRKGTDWTDYWVQSSN